MEITTINHLCQSNLRTIRLEARTISNVISLIIMFNDIKYYIIKYTAIQCTYIFQFNLYSYIKLHESRVCAVAQYAVLEANGKVNGIGEISNPSPSQTLAPIWMRLQIYNYVPPGSRCAKFG